MSRANSPEPHILPADMMAWGGRHSREWQSLELYAQAVAIKCVATLLSSCTFGLHAQALAITFYILRQSL